MRGRSRKRWQAVAEAGVYGAISDPTRRRLLDLMSRGEQPVNDLARPFRMTRPAISQHLRVLRVAGLVAERRVGRERRYRLRAAKMREVFDWVAHYQKFWTEKLEALRVHLDQEKR